MTTVTGTLTEPDGSVASGRVRFYLAGEDGRKVHNAFLTNGSIVRESAVTLNGSGVYSVTLQANDLILPAGTRWARVHGTTPPAFLYVPTAGPVSEEDILADAPGTVGTAALSQHAASTTLHGAGLELWSAVKSDSTFGTSVTGEVGVPITGWSAASTVPSRPWEIEATVEALGGGGGEGGSLTIFIDLPITAIARVGNVVTATLGTGHGVQVGAPVLADLSDNTFDGGPFTVTGATATTVTWAQVAADDADGGTGTLSVRVGVTSSWRAAVATLRAYARFPDTWWAPAAGLAYTARPRVRSSAGAITLLSGSFFGSQSQAIMTGRTR